MDTRRYAAFIAAAETQSMSGAAKRLGYTPSGIVRLVNALEADLGFSVLSRTTAGVSLTPEGARLLPMLRELVRLEERVEQTSARICGLAEGGLAVGVQAGAIPSWFPEVVRGYREKYPDIDINLTEDNKARLVEMVENHELDCALFYGRHNTGEWTALHPRELVAWVPSASLLAHNASLLLAELEGQDMIGVRAVEDAVPAELLEQRGISAETRYRLVDCRSAYSMVAAGMGCALCFDDLPEQRRPDVAVRQLSPRRFVDFGIMLSSSAAAPAVGEFRAFAVEFCKALPTVEKEALY